MNEQELKVLKQRYMAVVCSIPITCWKSEDHELLKLLANDPDVSIEEAVTDAPSVEWIERRKGVDRRQQSGGPQVVSVNPSTKYPTFGKPHLVRS